MISETIDLTVPSSPRSPTEGVHVIFNPIVDRRNFVSGTDDRALPQLATGGEKNPRITERAFGEMRIGPRRDSYLLPVGRTVAGVVEEAMIHAFHEAGFRVAYPDGVGAAGAISINSEIIQFWAWNSGPTSYHFEAQVAIQADLAPFQVKRTVSGTAHRRGVLYFLDQGVTARGDFDAVSRKGLADFIERLSETLRSVDPTHNEERAIGR